MANRHLLSVLSQNDLAALVGVKCRQHNLVALVILSAILSVSLIALSSAANPTGQQHVWARQQQLNHALKRQQQQLGLSPEYQLLQEIQAHNGKPQLHHQQQQEPPVDHYSHWQNNPIAPARNRDELIEQLKLARKLLDEQLEVDAAALSSSVSGSNIADRHRQQYEIPALDLGNELRYNPTAYYLANNDHSQSSNAAFGGLNSKSDQEANLVSRQFANELPLRQRLSTPNSFSLANTRRYLLPQQPLSSSAPTQLNSGGIGGNRIIIHLKDEASKNYDHNLNNNERLQNFNLNLVPQYLEQLRQYPAVAAIASSDNNDDNIKLEAAEKRMLAEDLARDPEVSFGTIQRQPVAAKSSLINDQQQQQQASLSEPARLVENKRQEDDSTNDIDDGDENVDKSERKSSAQSIPSSKDNINESEDQKTDQSEKRFTTLLEDEQQAKNNDDHDKSNSKATSAPDSKMEADSKTLISEPESKQMATASEAAKPLVSNTGKQVEIKQIPEAEQSLFRRVYDKLAGYVPFISYFKTNSNNNAKNSTTFETPRVIQQTLANSTFIGDLVKPSKVQVEQQDSDKTNEIKADKTTDEANAKLSVSSMANGSVKKLASGRNDERKSSVDKTNDKNKNNDKSLVEAEESDSNKVDLVSKKPQSEDGRDDQAGLQTIGGAKDDDLGGQESLSLPSMGTFESDNVNHNNQRQAHVTRIGTSTNNMKRHLLENGMQAKSLSSPSLIDDVELDNVLGQQQRHHHLIDEKLEPFKKISLIRQSNLVMPLTASDDLLLQAAAVASPNGNNDAGSKYIYAPTQHYYLTTGKLINGDSNDDNQNDEDRAAQRAAFFSQFKTDVDGLHNQQQHLSSHFQPGGHIYASSYEPLKPTYAYQQKASGLEGLLINGAGGGSTLSVGGANNNKSNDLYFLVMVGAFCVMAMAVVLAAGLFAYRVQQNRKSSNDMDYPTYGVVGPNNLNGKCGAAAFVGGYLGHQHHHQQQGGLGTGSSGSFGSKSGSSKHLPDLYACSDSGLASTDKGSSKKASSASASSDPQLQQSHVQAMANNRCSQGGTNFMANNQDAARMYHYQHQKQQMIISDRSSAGRHTSASDLDSEEENEDGSYTVYECPGLASAHEMEIKNPLFNDDQSP